MRQTSYAMRVFKVVLGMFIGGFSFYLIVQANIGLVPWDVFCMGLSYHLPITYGQAVTIMAVIVLTADLLLKEEIGVGSILDALLVGIAIDMYTALDLVPQATNVLEGILMMVVALLITGVAQLVYMSSGLSCGPRDALVMAIGRRMPKLPIAVAQWILQGGALLAGILLGGPVGIGTVIGAFGMGYAIQFDFNLAKFEPRDVQHEGLLQSLDRLKRLVTH